MNRFLSLFFSLGLFCASTANADIAPNPLTGGWPVSPYDEETTEVRMVTEDVVVRIYADSIVTVGVFSMRNDGANTDMVVGFPFPYEKDLIRFRAFIDDKPVNVRGASKEHSRGGKTWTTYWTVWDTTFPAGEPREIRVEYKTKPSLLPGWFFRRETYGAVSSDVLDKCQRATTLGNAEYWLDTGSPWKGILDHCRVTFEFAGLSAGHIQKYSPEDGVTTGNRIVWEYRDYQPRGWVNVDYFQYLPAEQVTALLLDTVEKLPDNPAVAYDAGRFLDVYLKRTDLQCQMYHSFLAEWNRPIPQLLEYASGGRCRLNVKAEGGFFSLWSMGRELFRKYKESGQLESGRDIAPTVARMSQAVVDSVATCNGVQNGEWFTREATQLRDACNDLIRKK